MARNLGLRTVAEGVETESQAIELARLGCEFAQGYLFFKPLSAVAMTALSEFERQPARIAPPAVEVVVPPAPQPVPPKTPPPLPSPPSSEAALPLPEPAPPVQMVPPAIRPLVVVTAQQPIVEPKPAEAKPAEAKPAEAKPAEAKPAEPPTGEGISHLLRPLLSN